MVEFSAGAVMLLASRPRRSKTLPPLPHGGTALQELKLFSNVQQRGVFFGHGQGISRIIKGYQSVLVNMCKSVQNIQLYFMVFDV